MSRSRPNILVTGTPGVGKTKFSSALQSKLGLEVINVGQFAKDNNLLGEWDEQYQSHELQEDPLLDMLEERLGKGEGGAVVEHHVPEVRPVIGQQVKYPPLIGCWSSYLTLNQGQGNISNS